MYALLCAHLNGTEQNMLSAGAVAESVAITVFSGTEYVSLTISRLNGTG